ncbi:Hypothetical_protein [Hexamita inflata]|uniref:Hypothetical_protein n=1 Tax=Hexamita inflata TaxID=28002 RepID=A0AA86UF28_9EUKA|nr:Hypothetical protein HINF_LOCUS26028 [Hexamita inflata]
MNSVQCEIAKQVQISNNALLNPNQQYVNLNAIEPPINQIEQSNISVMLPELFTDKYENKNESNQLDTNLNNKKVDSIPLLLEFCADFIQKRSALFSCELIHFESELLIRSLTNRFGFKFATNIQAVRIRVCFQYSLVLLNLTSSSRGVEPAKGRSGK